MRRLWSNITSYRDGFRARAAIQSRLRLESEHRRAFIGFYDSLRLTSDLVYVFFTGGLLRLPDDTAMNGCWLNYQGWAFLATRFLHINRHALADIQFNIPGISPRNYFAWGQPGFRLEDANLLADRERALALRMGSLKQSFDTLRFHQLACVAFGYKLAAVRKLNSDPGFK